MLTPDFPRPKADAAGHIIALILERDNRWKSSFDNLKRITTEDH